MDTFFGQAPQLAEILRIIIRYNLRLCLVPTKALCFLVVGVGVGVGVGGPGVQSGGFPRLEKPL